MKDNTVNNVYLNRIYELVDEYISTLVEKKDIYNKQCFNGLIKYINNGIGKVNYDDLVLLNDLWTIYSSICYKYRNTVSIERYCLLIGISRETFYSWKNGITKADYSDILGSSRSDMIKKWDEESENSWQDDAATGNPGSMFVLKARRGWQETAPAQVPQTQGITKTIEQIANEMGVPQLPDSDKGAAGEADF